MTGVTASQDARRTLARPAALQWSAVAVDASAIALAYLLARAIDGIPAASGDFGQWLMLSRYYTGEDVPAYRDVFGVAPLVPLLLAGLRVLLGGNDLLALDVLRFGMALAFPLALYAAGGSLFRSRAAGLIAAVLPFLLAGQFLELFAFGGLLQLASLTFMLLALAAVGQAAAVAGRERLWWTLAGLAAALAVLSHAGSVVIVVPAVASATLVVVASHRRRRSLKQWGVTLAPASAIGLAAIAYWAIVLVPRNTGYTNNPANWHYRGPDRLAEMLTASDLTTFAIAAAVFALAVGIAFEAKARGLGAFMIIASWAASTWGLAASSALAGTATDYPRFQTPMLLPLFVALAGGIAVGTRELGERLLPRWSPVSAQNAAGLVAVLALLAAMGAQQLSLVRRQASLYSIGNRDSLVGVSDWIVTNVPEGESVLMPSARDGKWIEGLTGRDTVFTNEVRFSFRAHEWDRSVAADAVVRSSTALTNGVMDLKFVGGTDTGAGQVAPRDLVIAPNHDGEYLDLLLMPDASSRVLADDGTVFATLGALSPVGVTRDDDGQTLTVRSVWAGTRRGVPVTWTRTVSMQRGNPTIEIDDKVESPAPLAGIDIEMRHFAGAPIELRPVGRGDNAALLAFTAAGQRQPLVGLQVTGAEARIDASGPSNVRVATSGAELHLRVTAATAGASISTSQILYPPEVIEQYRVGAVILHLGPAYESRLRRLAALGFCPGFESSQYVALTRTCPAGDGSTTTAGER